MIENKTYSDMRIDDATFCGEKLQNCRFIRCDFTGADLGETAFTDCSFYDESQQLGCRFERAQLRESSFIRCDLTMANFKHIDAIGCEIRESKASGADFRGASFMNMITSRSYFCRAYMTKNNFSYANFQKVVLEKCELWENRWTGANLLGANFSGSDLSGGEFHQIDWATADFTHCDITNSELGDLNIRRVNLEGVKIDIWQQSQLLERIGLIVVGSV